MSMSSSWVLGTYHHVAIGSPDWAVQRICSHSSTLNHRSLCRLQKEAWQAKPTVSHEVIVNGATTNLMFVLPRYPQRMAVFAEHSMATAAPEDPECSLGADWTIWTQVTSNKSVLVGDYIVTLHLFVSHKLCVEVKAAVLEVSFIGYNAQ